VVILAWYWWLLIVIVVLSFIRADGLEECDHQIGWAEDHDLDGFVYYERVYCEEGHVCPRCGKLIGSKSNIRYFKGCEPK
jgi:formamidopyrimidine-DNA glycosylase